MHPSVTRQRTKYTLTPEKATQNGLSFTAGVIME